MQLRTALGTVALRVWQGKNPADGTPGGYPLRPRGEGWGKKKTQNPRVAWHEHKLGVFYRQEQNAHGPLTDKLVVSAQSSPVEWAERLHWEALRAGLGRARETLAWSRARPGFGN